MKVLALEAYYGGSHKAFLDGWLQHSRHDWQRLDLPPSKWKWRMRHAAITFAAQVNNLIEQGNRWDALFCSDMLNLAEFLGLADKRLADIPKIAYFHENQLTYPVQVESERDYQYAVTNLTTALAADAVWFNTAFHRDEFLWAIERFLKKMPDFQPFEVIDIIRKKSYIQHPGIDPIEARPTAADKNSIPIILWAARWEHDKNPDEFFEALQILKEQGLKFKLNVIGEQFRTYPKVFDWAKDYFVNEILRWGYQPSKQDYIDALHESDIVISTANHEFYGISVVEAIAAGCYPILPSRLSYPEIVRYLNPETPDAHLFGQTAHQLAVKLAELLKSNTLQTYNPDLSKIQTLFWPPRAAEMDALISHINE